MLIAPAPAPDAAWLDTSADRATIAERLAAFDRELATHDSATLVLEQWCRTHRIGYPGTPIVAERQRDAEPPADDAVRMILRVGADEPVAHRHVRLSCGGVVLSDADNWYVPARLTPEMNRTLETSDTPFGRVVLPLGFRRRVLGTHRLWHPNGRRFTLPGTVIEARGLLVLADETPIATVVERYTTAILGTP